MKVCVLGLRGLPNVLGGVETHCAELYPRLARLRSGDEITVIGRRGYSYGPVTTYEGLTIVSLTHAKGQRFEAVSHTLCGLLYARFVLHSDLVHLHGIGPALFAPLAKSLRMKLVVTCHSQNYAHAKWNWLEKKILRAGELFAVIYADRIIAISEWLANDLRGRFPQISGKVLYVPNGAIGDKHKQIISETSPEVLRRYNLEDHNYILAVGRLVPEKGFDILVDAFEAASPPCKLVIAGDADFKDDYYLTLTRRATDRIVFTGFLSRSEVIALQTRASLFVLPSYHEGLPLAALEAIACGTPVVLSDIRPNLELRLPSHNYFDCGDADALARKLLEDHTSFGTDGSVVAQRFNWDTAATETAKIYAALEQS